MKGSLAGSVRAMLSFNVRAPIVVGLSLHWAWIWIVFWSSLFYDVWPSRLGFMPSSISLETLWVLSLLTNFLGAAAMGFASGRLKTVGSHTALPIMAALLAAVGTFVVAQPSLLFSSDFILMGYALGALITGLGSAMQFALWGELLTILGARQTVIYNVASIVAGGLIYFLLLAIPEPTVARNVVAASPVLGMLMFHMGRRATATYYEKQAKASASDRFGGLSLLADSGSKDMRKDVVALLALSLFFGLSYGLMKGLLVHGDASFIAFRDSLNILSFVAGALVALLTMSIFKMDFGSLTYQIALPLMALGFMLLSFEGYFKLIGFTLHQVGYQYFYAIIWALWPVLAKKNPRVPIAFFSCMSIASMQGGQFFGSFFGNYIFWFASGNAILVNQISSFAMFVILLVALFGFGGSRSNWGLVRPMGESVSIDKFEATCEQIAVTRGLSAREKEVFFLLARGRNADHICDKLVISKPTVKTHIKNIYRKLEVHSQQALIDMVELEGNAR